MTGVSRRRGIGHAITQRLVADGARVLVSGWTPHDDEMPWGADPFADDPGVERLDLDLEEPDTPTRLVDETITRFGAIDIVVANHARSSSQSLAELTVEELDRSWAVNARASLLLVQAFAAVHDDNQSGGRVVLFTSGQHRTPMANELPYAVSKGAIHQMTSSLGDALAGRGITVNCVNPGPVDTGWATGALHDAVAAGFPTGRWGTPDDVARVVAWLVSADAAWMTGQVLDSDGGFRGLVE